jgi:hypothetical protein
MTPGVTERKFGGFRRLRTARRLHDRQPLRSIARKFRPNAMDGNIFKGRGPAFPAPSKKAYSTLLPSRQGRHPAEGFVRRFVASHHHHDRRRQQPVQMRRHDAPAGQHRVTRRGVTTWAGRPPHRVGRGHHHHGLDGTAGQHGRSRRHVERASIEAQRHDQAPARPGPAPAARP